MVVESFYNFLSSAAVNITISGSTGISPFVSLLILSIIEKYDSNILNMNGILDKLLNNWFSIFLLFIITLIEVIGKCIPVLASFIDSIEIFIIPIISLLTSIGTLGLFDIANSKTLIDGDSYTTSNDGTDTNGTIFNTIMNNTNTSSNEYNYEFNNNNGRYLVTTDNNINNTVQVVGDNFLLFIKCIIVIIGVTIGFLLYLFKILIRLVGITLCCGCCDPCITIIEISIVIIGIYIAIFIRPIALVTCTIILVAACYVIHHRLHKKHIEQQQIQGQGQHQGQVQVQQQVQGQQQVQYQPNTDTLIPAATGVEINNEQQQQQHYSSSTNTGGNGPGHGTIGNSNSDMITVQHSNDNTNKIAATATTTIASSPIQEQELPGTPVATPIFDDIESPNNYIAGIVPNSNSNNHTTATNNNNTTSDDSNNNANTSSSSSAVPATVTVTTKTAQHEQETNVSNKDTIINNNNSIHSTVLLAPAQPILDTSSSVQQPSSPLHRPPPMNPNYSENV